MTDMKMPPALTTFLRTSERLQQLLGEYGQVTRARQMPENAATIYDRLVEVRSYSDRDPERSKVAADAARGVLARCKAEAFAEAEDKRDEKLREIAAELMVIRQTLPSITTRLAIELGVTSRQLNHEAEHGRS